MIATEQETGVEAVLEAIQVGEVRAHFPDLAKLLDRYITPQFHTDSTEHNHLLYMFSIAEAELKSQIGDSYKSLLEPYKAFLAQEDIKAITAGTIPAPLRTLLELRLSTVARDVGRQRLRARAILERRYGQDYNTVMGAWKDSRARKPSEAPPEATPWAPTPLDVNKSVE